MLKYNVSIPYPEDGGNIHLRKFSYTPTNVNNSHVSWEPYFVRLLLFIVKKLTFHFLLDITT
jgi:hypothetical protein